MSRRANALGLHRFHRPLACEAIVKIKSQSHLYCHVSFVLFYITKYVSTECDD